ncbi:UDP-glycosyltransferase UGT4-like isoform X2 [Adelges cooleyi]|nr:UDP-glycosyltransferase UGT4-like isoform X2 [Adelges cooleyi]
MELAKMNFLTAVPTMWYLGTTIARETLPNAVVQDFILSDDRHFNLVLVFAFCQEYSVALGHKYNAPVINLGVSMLWPSNSKWIGEPSTFSYIMDPRSGATEQASFFERFKNTVLGVFQLYLGRYFYLPRQTKIMNENFKYKGWENRPPLESMLKNVSLTLLNTHHSIGTTRPYMPSTVEIGGLHVKKPNKLTGEFLEFVESSQHGVIYFSFGTIVDPSKLPEEKIRVFIEVIKKLKQKVMWKWNSEHLPKLPDHVMVSDWFPQSDILGHPNVKIFITHGGLHSLEEATYNSKPIIGIPFFGDQHMNMLLVEKNGAGKMVDFHTMDEESLLNTINEVLENPMYQENSNFRNQVYKDQPMTPMDLAVYWIEYVIRHQGAPHLRSESVDLNTAQYFLLDILLVFVTFTSVLAYLIVKLFKCIFKTNVNKKV